jgi:hypothetical protein
LAASVSADERQERRIARRRPLNESLQFGQRGNQRLAVVAMGVSGVVGTTTPVESQPQGASYHGCITMIEV